MASSESTVAGLMSLSAPPSTSFSLSMGDKDKGVSGGAQTWSGKCQAGTEQQQPNHEVHTPAPAKVSLSEYRVKNADVLAAQKRKLENMEASVKREYANAAQALIGQQQRKEKQQHHHQQSSSSSTSDINPSPIILKIPLEKERYDRALKMRFPAAVVGSGSGHSDGARGQDPDIKVRIRVPEKQKGSSGEEGKSRDKHRDRANHHHHHHHPRHHHHHSSSTGASLSSSSHKHSSSSSGVPGSSRKAQSESSRSGSSSSSSSRKRTHTQDPIAGPHPAPKVSKTSRNPYQLPSLSSSGQNVGHGPDLLPSLGLPHNQGTYSHSKSDKTDTNGHSSAGGGQSNEYQDTFEMLNSLLSAQGVQPSQPSMFEYRSQYGDYRYVGGSRGNNSRPPPLPSEPPPPLPPLPK